MFIINSFWYSVVMAWCKLMKTGQTTSYRTGDDGDLEAGRDTDFSTLDANNPFGNTDRFTDELGGQTYTNNIVIDWSTFDGSSVLGYSKSGVFQSTRTWDNAIDFCLSYSIGSFTTGWRMSNRKELENILNYESTTNVLNYAPFYLASFQWVSTTNKNNTAQAYNLQTTTGNITTQPKTNNSYCIAVRTFTVSGTTLS